MADTRQCHLRLANTLNNTIMIQHNSKPAILTIGILSVLAKRLAGKSVSKTTAFCVKWDVISTNLGQYILEENKLCTVRNK